MPVSENKKELQRWYPLVFAALLVLVQAFFPTEGFFQSVISVMVFYVICPFLFFFLVLKGSFQDLFFKKGSLREGLLWSFISIVFSFLVLIAFSQYTDFLVQYRIPLAATESFGSFLGYELGSVSFFTAVYIFFFGAFVLSSVKIENVWKRSLGVTVFFAAALLLTGNLRWEFLPYLVFSYLGGVATLKSGSLIYSLLAQWLLIVLLDTFMVIIRT